MEMSDPHRVAKELGREDDLIQHYEQVIDRLNRERDAMVRRVLESIAAEHERQVARLNATIAALRGGRAK